MNKVGWLILAGSLAAAGFLVIVWIIGVLGHLGGALIHVLLVLALIVGTTGSLIGIAVVIIGKMVAAPLK